MKTPLSAAPLMKRRLLWKGNLVTNHLPTRLRVLSSKVTARDSLASSRARLLGAAFIRAVRRLGCPKCRTWGRARGKTSVTLECVEHMMSICSLVRKRAVTLRIRISSDPPSSRLQKLQRPNRKSKLTIWRAWRTSKFRTWGQLIRFTCQQLSRLNLTWNYDIKRIRNLKLRSLLHLCIKSRVNSQQDTVRSHH